jgi:hypothetical protein
VTQGSSELPPRNALLTAYRELWEDAKCTAMAVAGTWERDDIEPKRMESLALWYTSELVVKCLEAVGGQMHRRLIMAEGLRSGVGIDKKYDILSSIVTIPLLAEAGR